MLGQRARQSGLLRGGRYDHPDLLVDPVAHRRDGRGQVHRMGGRMTTTLGLISLLAFGGIVGLLIYALLAFGGIVGLLIYACAELMSGILDEEDDE